MFIIQQRIYIILALLAISNIKAPPIKQSTSDSDYFELERLNSEEESDESSSFIDRLIEQKHCSHFYNKTDDQNNVCGQDNNKNGLCNSTAICRDQTRNTLLYFHFPDNNNVEKTPVADGPEFQCIPTCLSGIISNGICFDNEEQQERINKICIDDTIDREEPLKTASLSSTILIVASVIIIVIVSCCIFCIKGHLNKSNTSLLATKSVLFSMKVKKKEKNRSFAIILKGYPRVFITAEEYDEIETKIFEEAGEFGDHIKITRNEMCYVKVDTYSQDACDWILQLKCSGIINNNFNIIPIEQVEKILVCLKYSGFPLQADKVPTYIMHNNREFEGCMITIDEDYCKDGVQNIVLKIDPKALMVFEEKQFKVKVRDHYYQFERFYKHDIHSISRLSIKEMDNPLITYMSQAE